MPGPLTFNPVTKPAPVVPGIQNQIQQAGNGAAPPVGALPSGAPVVSSAQWKLIQQAVDDALARGVFHNPTLDELMGQFSAAATVADVGMTSRYAYTIVWTINTQVAAGARFTTGHLGALLAATSDDLDEAISLASSANPQRTSGSILVGFLAAAEKIYRTMAGVLPTSFSNIVGIF